MLGWKRREISAVVRVAACSAALSLAACGADESSGAPADRRVAAVTGPTVSTDSPSYGVGATISVTYGGLPGNAKDWIAIASAGSANTSFVAWVYSSGQSSGTATFTAPAAGTYVARTFSNDTYTLLAESTAFQVDSLAVSTDRSSYPVGSTVTVTYAGLPGNLKDWIAIAAAGSANTSFVAWVYSNGQSSGSATFTAPAAGSYVARTFSNDTYTLLAESTAFQVSSTTVSTDRQTYTLSSTVTVTYAGLPGNSTDWIGIVPAGSPNTSYVAWVFSNGQTSGTATFSVPATFPEPGVGSYVARTFSNGTYTMLAESPPFTVAPPTISTDQAIYALGSTVTVTYAGMRGDAFDWIALAAAGSDNTSYFTWLSTHGLTSGTVTFGAPPAGSYVARAFSNGTYTLLGETPAFETLLRTVSPDRQVYTPGSTVTVRYAALPGYAKDWIAIAAAGSANTSFVSWVYSNGQTSGTATFTAPAAGSYVARAFSNDMFTLLAESLPFTVAAGGTVDPGTSVLMHHKHLNRDGLYVEPALTTAAAAGLRLDRTFNATFTGHVYGQPLYVDNGSGGRDLVIVATESDTVYAFDASSGQQVWVASLGTPVPLATFPCGNIDPMGITGTPVIDLASRTLFVTAMVTPDAGTTKQWKVFALSIDDGSVRTGWPIDVFGALGAKFEADVQGERGALTIVNRVLYVPFGGLAGDCGNYRGWVVAISLDDPFEVQAWSTTAVGGGIWAPSGITSDGSAIYVATGNTVGATSWGGGEAILRFESTSPPLATAPAYWAPTTWQAMDMLDQDMGGTAPVVFDLPGSAPSHLVLGLSKTAYGYLEDANNLGGISNGLFSAQVSAGAIRSAAALYTTGNGTFVTFAAFGALCTGGTSGGLETLRMVPGSPPTIGGSWCAAPTGAGGPIVTTTDGQSNFIVWVVGSEGNDLLQGYDGETGSLVYLGTDVLTGSRRWTSPIAAKGRIFVAGDNMLVAFGP